MAFKVREMRRSDARAVYALGRGVRELYGSEGGGWYPEEALLNWLGHKRDDILLVCEKDGRVIGFSLTYVHYRMWALMDSIAVDEGERRGGAATAMIRETMRRMDKLGIVYAQCYVNTTNRGMLRLMRKLKFNVGSSFYSCDMLFPKNFM